MVVFQCNILNKFSSIHDLIDNMNNKIYYTLRTAAISNGQILDTDAKSLPLTHMYMESALILIVLELGAQTHTFV